LIIQLAPMNYAVVNTATLDENFAAAWYSHYLSIKNPINRWLIMLIHHESFSWILPQYLILTIYCTKWDNPPVVFVGYNQPPFTVDISSRINRYINSRCITMYNHHSL
jgi:hypothetical protein